MRNNDEPLLSWCIFGREPDPRHFWGRALSTYIPLLFLFWLAWWFDWPVLPRIGAQLRRLVSLMQLMFIISEPSVRSKRKPKIYTDKLLKSKLCDFHIRHPTILSGSLMMSIRNKAERDAVCIYPMTFPPTSVSLCLLVVISWRLYAIPRLIIVPGLVLLSKLLQ